MSEACDHEAMKLGIDFGTTRIVVAAVDRGNYPLVHFETPDGVYDEWFPSLVSLRPAENGLEQAERRYGWEAWQAIARSGRGSFVKCPGLGRCSAPRQARTGAAANDRRR